MITVKTGKNECRINVPEKEGAQSSYALIRHEIHHGMDVVCSYTRELLSELVEQVQARQ